MWTHGSFYWNELMTHDVDKTKRYYTDVLGWSFDAMPMPNGGGTYWVAKMGDKSIGGIFPMKGPEFAKAPERWVPYVAVDDVDARVKRASAAGATVCHAPFDIPNVGRIAVLTEPGGAMIGFMTPAQS
jgi:predicted enzyme related to lactoylglutathione lyase